MAKGGDKRRLVENEQHIRKLQTLIAVANGAYLLFRSILQGSTWTGWHYCGLILTSISYFFCYSMIQAALAPHYDPYTQELIYSGADLKTGGVIDYYHDVLYIAAATQLFGCYSDKAWYIYLAIPGYALYMFTNKVLVPYFNAPDVKDIPETAMERKRREKRERQEDKREKRAGYGKRGG